MDHQPTTKKPIWHSSLTLEGINAWGRVNELADYKRVPPEKLRPWPMGTGQAVTDWLAARHDSASIRTA